MVSSVEILKLLLLTLIFWNKLSRIEQLKFISFVQTFYGRYQPLY